MPTRYLTDIPTSLKNNYRLFFLICLFNCPVPGNVLQAQLCDCITMGNCPTAILNNQTTTATLNVGTSGPNDLSQCPLQSVCFTISHTWIGDLSVSLTSPDGTKYLLMADGNNDYGGCGLEGENIDVCIVTGTHNPVTNGGNYDCNLGFCDLGYCCLTDEWTLPYGVSDPISGALEAPNHDLNDFNQPGAPINGPWTLTVNDVCSHDDGVLENFSLHFACGETLTTSPVITPLTPLACSPTSTDSCQKVCAKSTVVYELDNLPPGAAVDWEITGAQEFTPDSNTVSVFWGVPGEGGVAAETDVTYPGWSPPKQIFCGQIGYGIHSSGQPIGTVQIFFEELTSPKEINYINGINGSYQTEMSNIYSAAISPLAIGPQAIQVVDGDGDYFYCSVNIQEHCVVSVKPTLIDHASGHGTCDGRIILEKWVGPGPFTYEWSSGETSKNVYGLCKGFYTVTVTNANNCSTSHTFEISCRPYQACYTPAAQCVQILQNPTAGFTASVPLSPAGAIEICQGQEVSFENTSQAATDYVWSFGDGQFSTQEAPIHTYQTPGSFTASLIARNDCFCADTAVVNVVVQAADLPPIDCLGSICEGETVTYSTESQCNNYSWNVSPNGNIIGGGGTSDPFVTVEWLTGPEGSLSLQTADCGNLTTCNAPNVLPIAIMSENAEISGPEKICASTVAEYTIPDFIGASINWEVSQGGTLKEGQGSNRITVAWEAGFPNPQYVAVFFENCFLGCEGRDTLMVNIRPQFFAGGDIQFCQNETGTFFAKNAESQSPVTCNWQLLNEAGNSVWSTNSLTSTNIPFSFPAGNYLVKAAPKIVDDYCNDFYEIPIRIFGLPPAVGSIDGESLICPGNSYTYSAVGLGQTGVEWIVQDGNNSYSLTGNPINVTWGDTSPRGLTVRQTSSDGLSCSSGPTTLTIEEMAPAGLSGPIDACVGTTQNYSASSTLHAAYQWTITPEDAGTIATGQGTPHISVQWQAAGSAILKLMSCGLPNSLTINIFPNPTPEVEDAAVCPGVTIPLTTTESYPSYQWKNAAGTPVFSQPSATLGAGHYQVQVIDENGCTGGGIFEIIQHPQPEFILDAPYTQGICLGGVLPIYASTMANGLDFQWSLNGNTFTNNAASHTATLVGEYVVEATDPNGCTASRSIYVPGCEENGGLCDFSNCIDTTTTNGGGVLNNPGTSFTCTPAGMLLFSSSPTADCAVYDFFNNSVDFVPGSLNWNFDDPGSGAANIATEENPQHTFSSPGFFLVRLSGDVESDIPGQSCEYRFTKEDTVLAVANFSATNACPGLPVQFTDRTQFMPFASLTGWSWDFGDPASGPNNSSNLQHPVHAYSAPGIYEVTIAVTIDGSCQTVFSKNINVYDLPSPNFAPVAASCENTPMNFTAVSTSGAASFSWEFGDPGSGAANTSNLTSIAHQFSENGNFEVTLTATNIYGCSSVYHDSVSILPNTLSGQIIFSQASPICAGDSIVLSASASEPASFLWSNGATSPNITVTSSATYQVTFSNPTGCTFVPSPATIDVVGIPNGTVQGVVYNENGQPGAIYQNHYTTCHGEDVNLEVTGQPGYTYQWSNGSTDTELVFGENTSNALGRGEHVFTVTITDSSTGCTSVEGITVEVFAVPSVEIASNPGGIICENTPVVLFVTAPETGVNYTWTTGETGHTIDVIGSGRYYAVAVNDVGCNSRSNEIDIQNAPGKNNVPLGCLTRCLPTEICLPELPEVTSYQWYLDGQALPAPMGTQANPSFSQSGDYQLEMTDMDGCTSLSGILSLDLLEGFGRIGGEVYFDVNENGIVDAGDTVVSDVNLFLLDSLGLAIDTAASNFAGRFSFANIPSAAYTLLLDTLALPTGWSAVLTSQDEELVGCDDEATTVWLLFKTCTPAYAQQGMEACAGDSVVYDGIPLLAGTSHLFSLQTTEGCDSLVTVDVTVLPHTTSLFEEVVCEGSFFEFQGQAIPPGETAIFTEINVNGCLDSSIVSVSSLPTSTASENIAVCPDSTFTFLGSEMTPGDTREFTLENAFGCDSTLTVSVSALPHATEYVDGEACFGETFYFQGQSILAGETVIFTATNPSGCIDSTIVNVTALVSSLDSLSFSACKGDSVIFDGAPIPAGSTETFNYPSANGCDSVLLVQVDTLPYKVEWVSGSACEGSFYEYLGEQIAPGNTVVFTEINTFGCIDSTVVYVAPVPTTTGSEEINACPGTIISYLGTELQTGDSQIFTIENSLGCDSTITVTVTPLSVDSTFLTYEVCPEETVDFQGVAIPAGQTEVFLFDNQQGCDSVVSVYAQPLLQAAFSSRTDSACFNAADGQVEVFDVLGGEPPLLFSLDGGAYQEEAIFENIAAGSHTISVLNANGCAGEQQLTIPTIPPMTIAAMDETLRCGDSLLLQPDVYSWLPIEWEWFGKDGAVLAATPELLIRAPGMYSFSVKNDCETQEHFLTVHPEDDIPQSLVYMPNGFSPNN
ncbi:MAG: PKD domain-containing protein [Bacteroidota bacterium]